MFGMGPAEIAVILIVAVMVFGPEKLPDLARQAGRFVRTARQMMDNAKNDLAAEMGDEFDELRNLNLRDLDPREIVRRNVVEAMESGDGAKPADSAKPAVPATRLGHLPLAAGERPPFDPEAT